jgi:hypothetical protein
MRNSKTSLLGLFTRIPIFLIPGFIITLLITGLWSWPARAEKYKNATGEIVEMPKGMKPPPKQAWDTTPYKLPTTSSKKTPPPPRASPQPAKPSTPPKMTTKPTPQPSPKPSPPVSAKTTPLPPPTSKKVEPVKTTSPPPSTPVQKAQPAPTSVKQTQPEMKSTPPPNTGVSPNITPQPPSSSPISPQLIGGTTGFLQQLFSEKKQGPSAGWQSDTRGPASNDSLKDNLSNKPIQGNRVSPGQKVPQADTLPSVDALPGSASQRTDSSPVPSSDDGVLPPWVPAAAGAAAGGAAALGSLLTMAASGVRPREVWDGLKDLLTQHPATGIDDQTAYDEAEKRFQDEKAQYKPKAGETNKKGEIYDAATKSWVNQKDSDVLMKTEKLAAETQEKSITRERKWMQEDVNAALDRLYKKEDQYGIDYKRRSFLEDLKDKAKEIEGLKDHDEVFYKLMKMSDLIEYQKSRGFLPAYTYKDALVDTYLRSAAMGLDCMGGMGAFNATVTFFQTSRDELRAGADLSTALKDGTKMAGIDLAISAVSLGAGKIAPKYGVSELVGSSVATGGLTGGVSAYDTYTKTGSLKEASYAFVKDGTYSGVLSYGTGKVTELATTTFSGSKVAPEPGSGLPKESISLPKPGKGPSERFPGLGPEELPQSKILKPLERDQFNAKHQEINAKEHAGIKKINDEYLDKVRKLNDEKKLRLQNAKTQNDFDDINAKYNTDKEGIDKETGAKIKDLKDKIETERQPLNKGLQEALTSEKDAQVDAIEAERDVKLAAIKAKSAPETHPGLANDSMPPPKTGKGLTEAPPEVMEKIESTRKHIITTKDGKKMMDVQEALKLQQDTRTMRTLKTGNPAEVGEVRTALGNTLKDVKKMHEADLIQKVRATNPALKNVEMQVEEISTRGKTTEFSTDRDYRLVYKDKNGQLREVPKEQWQHLSQESFAEVTSYNPNQFRASLSTAEKARFDQMSRSEQLDFYQQKSNWKATDKAHIEASPDYSDQSVDLKTGKRKQLKGKEINIINVYDGYAKLNDPVAHGQMYHAKVKAELNAGNKCEAFVQSKKGVEALEHCREGYGKQNIKYGKLPPNLKEGMKLIKDNAEGIGRGDTARMAKVEKGLKDLDFKDLDDFSNKVSSQIDAIEWLK